MNGRTNTNTVREKGSQSKHGGHKTCAPQSMPLCCHSLTYLLEKGETLLSKLALALPVMPHSRAQTVTETEYVCLPQSGLFLEMFETRCGSISSNESTDMLLT